MIKRLITSVTSIAVVPISVTGVLAEAVVGGLASALLSPNQEPKCSSEAPIAGKDKYLLIVSDDTLLLEDKDVKEIRDLANNKKIILTTPTEDLLRYFGDVSYGGDYCYGDVQTVVCIGALKAFPLHVKAGTPTYHITLSGTQFSVV